MDENIFEIEQEMDEVNDQLGQVQGMIREEEQRYHKADENQRLKRMFADLSLKHEALKDIVEKKL